MRSIFTSNRASAADTGAKYLVQIAGLTAQVERFRADITRVDAQAKFEAGAMADLSKFLFAKLQCRHRQPTS